MNTRTDIQNAKSPGLLRRLAAIFYDLWLVAAIWLIGATIDTFVRAGLGLDSTGSHLPLQVFLFIAPVGFFGWFWTHGGQTLGMRAWRLRLLAADGSRVTWRQAIIRCLAAAVSLTAFGLGYLWILFDRDHLAWHDRLSDTRLVILARD